MPKTSAAAPGDIAAPMPAPDPKVKAFVDVYEAIHTLERKDQLDVLRAAAALFGLVMEPPR